MKVKGELNHLRQYDNFSCGCLAYSALLGISLETARRECKTDKSGTHLSNIAAALKNRGIENHLININQEWDEYRTYLRQNSLKWPIIVGYNKAVRHYVKGRNKEICHAVLVADSNVYCGGQDSAVPIEAFISTGITKSWKIDQIIIIEEERPNFFKNSLEGL